MHGRLSSKSLLLTLCCCVCSVLCAVSAVGEVGQGPGVTGPRMEAAAENDTMARQVEYLSAFARLYGYVRFFHPSDEAASIDWDAFAIHGSSLVQQAQSRDELLAVLRQLFLPLGPGIRIFAEGETPELVDEPPQDTAGLEVVAWQHEGMSMGEGGNELYRSKRLNRPVELQVGRSSGFGNVMTGLDAGPYRGMQVRLRAAVRVVAAGRGVGQLWLRVDRPENQVGSFDNMQDRPISSSEWAVYEITGAVAQDADRIVFGCFLRGEGQLWVDDIELQVLADATAAADEAEPAAGSSGSDTWQAITVPNAGFEENSDGQPWRMPSTGYRYTVTSEQPYHGAQSMHIKDEMDVEVLDEPLFEQHAAVGEVIDKPLGAGLRCLVPLALYSRDGHTIPSPVLPLEPLIAGLDSVDDGLSADALELRLAGIVIAWNVFQHFYPYFDVIDTDWQEMLPTSLRRALSDTGPEDFLRTLQLLTASLQDGHAGVDPGEQETARQWLELSLEAIGDQVVVAASEESELQPGDIILGIDGRPAPELLAEEERLISGSPQWKRYRALGALTQGEPGSVAELAVQRQDRKLTVQVERHTRVFLRPFAYEPIEQRDDGVFYVDLAYASWPKIEEQLEQIATAPGVVFDLRGYPRGNHKLLNHLLTEKDTHEWMHVPHVIYPDQEQLSYRDSGWELEPQEPHITGTVVFLTDGMAISYAESFMGFIEGYQLADIVGGPTAGTNGNVNRFLLPGGYLLRWTGMRVLKHDGSQHHLIGVLPTVPVHPTVAGLRAGRDEQLDKALELIHAAMASAGESGQDPGKSGPGPETTTENDLLARQVEYLTAFARLYGFVRFFHPSDEAASIDWDAFAIHGSALVQQARSREELQRVLRQLFLPLGPGIRIVAEGETPAPMDEPPQDAAGLEVVAWQHQGMWLSEGGNDLYRSKRLNRPVELKTGFTSGFGNLATTIDAEPYRGRQVRLRAAVRVVSEERGQGQLWLRIDRPDKQIGFFDNMRDRPITSPEWAVYEITGEVAADAEKIAFGCFLRGNGRLWVDDIELQVLAEASTDGSETGQPAAAESSAAESWQAIAVPNAGFEEGSDGQPWSMGSRGYRYFVTSEQPHGGAQSLCIEDEVEEVILDEPLFERHATVGEMIDKPLGAGLRCLVPLALYSRDGHTIPGPALPLAPLTAEFDNVDDGLTADALELRLADVVIAWNVFQHFSPYLDVIDTDWQEMLPTSLRRALTDSDAEDFFPTLQLLIAALQDGHASIGPDERFRAWRWLELALVEIDNQVVVAASHESELQPGDIILSIDGRPAPDLLAEEERLISGSPQWKRYSALSTLSWGDPDKVAELVVERQDGKHTVQLERHSREFLRPFLSEPIEQREDGIFYIDLSHAPWPQIEEQLEQIAAAPGLVCDLRGYPSSNHQLLNHLLTEKDTHKWMFTPYTIYPDQEQLSYLAEGWELEPQEPHIAGTVVFLTDGMAISYAESVMGFIEAYRLADIVGGPTAGTNGSVNILSLPGGYKARWTGMRVLKHDGSQHHLIGVLPTVPVHPTVAGLRAGKDEQLDKALELIHTAMAADGQTQGGEQVGTGS